MKKLILITGIIGLILALTISAFALWGVFDLTGYNSATVNSAMASYTTPSSIVSYMASHFSAMTYHAAAYNPYQMYVYKRGDCNDFSTYAIYCAYKNGHPKNRLYQIYIVHTDGTSHMLGMYTFVGGYYHYSSNQSYYTGCYSWTDCVGQYDAGTSRTVRYADLYDYDLNFIMRWTFN